MHPMEIVESIDRLQERLRVVPGDDPLSIEAQKNATLFFNILLRSTFASNCVKENNGKIEQSQHLQCIHYVWIDLLLSTFHNGSVFLIVSDNGCDQAKLFYVICCYMCLQCTVGYKPMMVVNYGYLLHATLWAQQKKIFVSSLSQLDLFLSLNSFMRTLNLVCRSG